MSNEQTYDEKKAAKIVARLTQEQAALAQGITPDMLAAKEFYDTHGGEALDRWAMEHPIRPILRNRYGQGMFHIGDMSGIKAQVGNGKTLAASLFAAAALAGAEDFGLKNQEKVNVIYFDTELSGTLTCVFKQRVVNRLQDSSRFYPVNMQDFAVLPTSEARQKFVENLIDYFLNSDNRPVFAILDGIVELIDDSNGFVESKKFLEELTAFTAHRNCHILNIIHENQGNDGGKATGNIGSFLYKKVREMYKVSRNGDVFTVENGSNRNGCKYQYGSGVAPISFRVTPEWGIEPTDAPEVPKKLTAQDRKANIFRACFEKAEVFTHDTLAAKYEQVTHTKPGNGKKAISAAMEAGILHQDEWGRYRLTADWKDGG